MKIDNLQQYGLFFLNIPCTSSYSDNGAKHASDNRVVTIHFDNTFFIFSYIVATKNFEDNLKNSIWGNNPFRLNNIMLYFILVKYKGKTFEYVCILLRDDSLLRRAYKK